MKVRSVAVPDQQTFGGDVFPLVLHCDTRSLRGIVKCCVLEELRKSGVSC